MDLRIADTSSEGDYVLLVQSPTRSLVSAGFWFCTFTKVYATVVSTQSLGEVQDNVSCSPRNNRQRIKDQAFSLGLHNTSAARW